MLVYAAIVPHSPFAIESVSKKKIKELESTVNSMSQIGEDLISLNIDTILIISPFGERYVQALGIAFHDPYIASLREFGVMSTLVTFKPDMMLIDKIQRTIRQNGLHSTMTTNDELDHGSAIPLIMLDRFIKDKKLVVLTPPVVSAKELVQFGESIREAINDTNTRVAVLCSAELSHRLSAVSPGGVHKDAEAFDRNIRSALVDGNSVQLLKISEKTVNEQGAQGLDSIRMFWGLLGDTDYTMNELAYEHPYGIGHLTMVAKLH